MPRILIALLFTIFLIPPASAEPKTGDYGPLGSKAFFCDTKAQIENIVQAGREDGAAGIREKYEELNKIVNDRGEATCATIPGDVPVMVGESFFIGDITVGDKVIRSWIINVGTSKIEGWILWGDLVASQGI